MTGCSFKHDDIDTLHGVAAMPVEDLPTTCTCGRPLTYADEVAFVTTYAASPCPDWIKVSAVVLDTRSSPDTWPSTRGTTT